MPTSHPNTLDVSDVAHQHDAGDAFAALPVHILITHVLSSGNLPDPSDLARLRAVSREMRDAVAVTGREVYELKAWKAIQLGDISGMQLLHHRGDLDELMHQGSVLVNDYISLCTLAAKEEQLEILRWLRENDFPWDENTCEEAAGRGNLEVLQWLRANGCPWKGGTCWKAALGWHLEVLQWARANGCPWHEWKAAMGGHLEVLQWARASGCPWDRVTCTFAASYGHLEVLQWAHENGCPWDEETCEHAARDGHHEVLQWARANSCPWDERTCAMAAAGGHLEVLQWLRAN